MYILSFKRSLIPLNLRITLYFPLVCLNFSRCLLLTQPQVPVSIVLTGGNNVLTRRVHCRTPQRPPSSFQPQKLSINNRILYPLVQGYVTDWKRKCMQRKPSNPHYLLFSVAGNPRAGSARRTRHLWSHLHTATRGGERETPRDLLCFWRV